MPKIKEIDIKAIYEANASTPYKPEFIRAYGPIDEKNRKKKKPAV